MSLRPPQKAARFVLKLLPLFLLWPHGFALAAQTPEQVRDELQAGLPCEPCKGLTGDWNGRRRVLLENGVEITFANIGDALFIRQEDNDEVTYTNFFEAGLAFDMEKLAELDGGSAYVWAVGTHGDNPADVIGSIHAPSNIAAPDAFRLLEAWYEQSAHTDRLGVLVGFYAVDTEFDSKGTVNVFAAGSHGTGLDLSESGINGPSIFPVTSFGTRIRYGVSENLTARLAILDGVPGDPDDPTKTAVFKWSDEEGIFAIGEIDYAIDTQVEFRRFVLGAWHYTTDFDDLLDTQPDGSPVRRNGSSGLYGFAEWLIFSEDGTTEQGLAGVVRLGVADEDVNQIAGYYGAGLVYRGLFPGRDKDTIGVGFSTGVNSDKFRRAQELAGAPVTERETEWVFLYSAQVNRWLRLQPLIQYYIDPGTDPGAANALVAGVRIAILL